MTTTFSTRPSDHPERVSTLIVQNGNAYDEGLKDFRDPIKAHWADGSAAHRDALSFLVEAATTPFQYTDGVDNVSRVDLERLLL
jgi:hypothetical protein